MVVAMRGFLLALAVALFAPPSLAVTPPTCTNAGDTWGGGQLLSECSGNCEGEQLCVELFAEHYTCLNQTEPSTFVLLVRDAGYESDEDVAAQAVDSLYSVELSALPNDTDLYPHILNCYLYNVSALELAPLTTQFILSGGDTYRAFYKGHVSYINLTSAFLSNQTQVTNISLVSLDLKGVLVDLPAKLPASLTHLDLRNDLINEFPTQLSVFPLLETLSLDGNFLTKLEATDVIQTLKSLNLASNNMTAMPASLARFDNLLELHLGSNFIQEVTAADSSDTLTVLNLTDNHITTFEATFANLETLYLANNHLTMIPASLYSCSKLRHLFLSGDGAFLLSNTFTESQFAFLQNLDTLNVTAADFNTQDVCQSNGTQLLRNAIQVCLASTDVAVAETPTASNHSAVIPGISGGLVAVLLIATLVRHRCRRIPGQFAAELDDPKLLLLLLKPAEIKDIKKIADGGHTIVWLVKYRKSQLLAAKRLRKDQAHVASHQHDVKVFVAEIKLAASLEHPNIVKLIGAAWTTKTAFQALFEYMNSGNVREYLALPSTPREWNAPKLQIAVGVAEALVYLHSFVPAVLHRDLNSSTVLLNSALQAKLIKAGVSQLRSADNVEKQQQAGRGPWQAPEVLAGAQDGDQAADIFSFGVLLSELDTHAIPYSDVGSIRNTIVLADAAILQLIAAGSIRLRFGEGCPPDLRTLAGRCLAQDPRARPAAPEVAYALRALKKSLHW